MLQKCAFRYFGPGGSSADIPPKFAARKARSFCSASLAAGRLVTTVVAEILSKAARLVWGKPEARPGVGEKIAKKRLFLRGCAKPKNLRARPD
jgi:hypothetical protein